MADEKSRDPWEKADAAASIASKLLIPVILVVATSLLSRGIQDRQAAVSEGGLNRQWVELALGVLQNDDMKDQKEIRAWSVAVINHYMPEQIQLPPALRDGLVDGTVRLPASTPWSISGPEVQRIQAALNAGGLCDTPLMTDGMAGFSTRYCLRRFLDSTNDIEVQGLVSRSPSLLAAWVENGAPPPDWRAQAGAALTAPPVVEVMPEDWQPFGMGRRTSAAGASAPARPLAADRRAESPVARIQSEMAAQGLCDARPDGAAGMLTVACVAGYLGDATPEETRALLADAPELLLGWIEAGPVPADWRARAASR